MCTALSHAHTRDSMLSTLATRSDFLKIVFRECLKGKMLKIHTFSLSDLKLYFRDYNKVLKIKENAVLYAERLCRAPVLCVQRKKCSQQRQHVSTPHGMTLCKQHINKINVNVNIPNRIAWRNHCTRNILCIRALTEKGNESRKISPAHQKSKPCDQARHAVEKKTKRKRRERRRRRRRG